LLHKQTAGLVALVAAAAQTLRQITAQAAQGRSIKGTLAVEHRQELTPMGAAVVAPVEVVEQEIIQIQADRQGLVSPVKLQGFHSQEQLAAKVEIFLHQVMERIIQEMAVKAEWLE
jgi:hypothetical protein